MNFEITKGKIKKPYKVVVYGPEGIGKSTFASHFPDPFSHCISRICISHSFLRFRNPNGNTTCLMMEQKKSLQNALK